MGKTKKKKKEKKAKQKKLQSIPTIRHRLHRLWSEIVRGRASYKCELCGMAKGEINKNGKETKIDAHHFLSKEIKDCPLKFDIMNSVSVCTFCHKFGIPSFHRDPVRTITWLQKERPERYQYVLAHADIRVDLENRKVLEEIENKLKQKLPLDFALLKEIERLNPRAAPKKRLRGTLFDKEPEEPEEPESSSSSSES